MAKFELKFIDMNDDGCSVEVNELDGFISIFATDEKQKNTSGVCIQLDKSTAIKFAKTLRTEINKITELETLKAGDFTTLTGQPRKENNNG